MKQKFSLTDRFKYEQKQIRDEIQCLLDDIAERLNNRQDDGDGAVAELLRQVDATNSAARGACMRLKECKRLHALVQYMIDEKQVTQNTYGTDSNDNRSHKKQAG